MTKIGLFLSFFIILLKYSSCQFNIEKLREVEIVYSSNNLTNKTDFIIKLPLNANSLDFSNVWIGLGFNNARKMVFNASKSRMSYI